MNTAFENCQKKLKSICIYCLHLYTCNLFNRQKIRMWLCPQSRSEPNLWQLSKCFCISLYVSIICSRDKRSECEDVLRTEVNPTFGNSQKNLKSIYIACIWIICSTNKISEYEDVLRAEVNPTFCNGKKYFKSFCIYCLYLYLYNLLNRQKKDQNVRMSSKQSWTQQVSKEFEVNLYLLLVIFS